MKKYENYTQSQLIEVIREKNNTISILNGKLYANKRMKEYFKTRRDFFRNKYLKVVENGK